MAANPKSEKFPWLRLSGTEDCVLNYLKDRYGKDEKALEYNVHFYLLNLAREQADKEREKARLTMIWAFLALLSLVMVVTVVEMKLNPLYALSLPALIAVLEFYAAYHQHKRWLDRRP